MDLILIQEYNLSNWITYIYLYEFLEEKEKFSSVFQNWQQLDNVQCKHR